MVGRLAAIAPPVVVRKEDAASVRGGGGGSTRAGRAGWAGDSSLQCLRCAVIAGCRRARQGVLVVAAEVPGLGGLQGVSAAGRSQEEYRRGTGYSRRGVMNWNDSGGGGTFSRDRRGLLSPALVLANLPTCQLFDLSACWEVGG